jgi:hypothetical protein
MRGDWKPPLADIIMLQQHTSVASGPHFSAEPHWALHIEIHHGEARQHLLNRLIYNLRVLFCPSFMAATKQLPQPFRADREVCDIGPIKAEETIN